jgi:hypothetical protein
VQHWARTSEARQICQVLGCLFLFSRIYLWGPKTVPDRIPEDIFFLAFSGGIFTGMWFWRGRRNSNFFRFYGNFSQEFLWAGIPVFTPDSSGIRRIPVPTESCLAQASDKEGSLLSTIWTKIDIFNLSPKQDLTMVSAAPVLCWPLLA